MIPLDTTHFEIIVKTNARKTNILSYDEERQVYIVEVAAQPENNKANVVIEKFFTKYFQKPCTIISGKTSKKKLIRVG